MGTGSIAVWVMGGLLCILGFALSDSGPRAHALSVVLIGGTAICALAMPMLHYGTDLFWDPHIMSEGAGILPAALGALLIWLAWTFFVLARGAEGVGFRVRIRI
jgi:hypothetical protein